MTKKRQDSHSTEFGLWLREQPEIRSYDGYRATNVDYCWKHVGTNNWMFIEEKRYMTTPSYTQECSFRCINNACQTDAYYRGFHLLQFQNTNPDDGRIYLDNKEITRDDLLEFLQFEKSKEWYKSYYSTTLPEPNLDGIISWDE